MSKFIAKLQKRVAQEESGFTLIELLIVLVIIGILLAIAVPSYLGFKDRANKAAAQANVRSAIPAAEAYYSDNGNYTGMDIASGASPNAGGLKGIDAGIKLNKVTVPTAGTLHALRRERKLLRNHCRPRRHDQRLLRDKLPLKDSA